MRLERHQVTINCEYIQQVNLVFYCQLPTGIPGPVKYQWWCFCKNSFDFLKNNHQMFDRDNLCELWSRHLNVIVVVTLIWSCKMKFIWKSLTHFMPLVSFNIPWKSPFVRLTRKFLHQRPITETHPPPGQYKTS